MIEKDDLSAIWHGHPSPGTVSGGDLPRIWGLPDLGGVLELYREILYRLAPVTLQTSLAAAIALTASHNAPATLALLLQSPATLQYLAANPVTLQLILEGWIEDA